MPMSFGVLGLIAGWTKKSNPINGGNPDFMAFNGVDGRLLLLLAKKWKEKGTGGPYRTSMIYKGYPELPDEYITGELNKCSTKGLITFTSDGNRFYLADRGISQIKSFISIDRWNAVGI
jgi:hypothetical protein